jgi:hypothetical protein
MRWIWLLWVGVVTALLLALLALWRPLPWTGVVYAGKWCCAQCSDAPPVKCTGCQTKAGACPLNAPTTLDCPGLTTQTLITGGGELGESVTCF